MRALYGFLLCGTLAVVFSFIWPQRDRGRIRGLWVGTLAEAKAMFKGSEPNDDDLGEKVRIELKAGPAVERDPDDDPKILVPKAFASRMKAREGDMIYVCDKRWYLGGLRSLHGRLVMAEADGEEVIISANDVEDARLRVGELVVVEKIL